MYPNCPADHPCHLVEIFSMTLEAFVQEHFMIIGYVALARLVVLWGFPKVHAARISDLKDRLTLENAARQMLAQIIGGTLIFVGLYFTAETLRTA
jgi:hypothetical protein